MPSSELCNAIAGNKYEQVAALLPLPDINYQVSTTLLVTSFELTLVISG